MQGIKEICNFVQLHIFYWSVISDNCTQTGSNQFKQVSSFSNFWLVLLLQSPLKTVISDTLTKISEESLSCQNYCLEIIPNFLSMWLFFSFLTYFQIENLKNGHATQITTLIYSFSSKNYFCKVTIHCTIQNLKSP